MSDHVLKAMRDDAKNLLNGVAFAGGPTTTQAFTNRAEEEPLQDSELPGYRVWLTSGDDQVQSFGYNRISERIALLTVEGCAKKNATFEDDAIELQRIAETQLVSVTGAKSVDLVHWEIDRDAGGEKPRVVNRMTFRLFYCTAAGAPQTAL